MKRVIFGLAWVALATASTVQAANFQGLGFLSGGSTSSVSAISADGSTVVGSGNSATGSQGFVWTSGTGMVGVGDLPGGGTSSGIRDVSSDGSVAVGTSQGNFNNGFLLDYTGVRWTSGGGLEALTSANPAFVVGNGSAASTNGELIVGHGPASFPNKQYLTAPYFWTPLGGAVPFDPDPSAVHSAFHISGFVDVSSDGTRALGYDQSFGGSARYFEWASGGTVTWLDTLPALESSVDDMSSDGTHLVGYGNDGAQDYMVVYGPDRVPHAIGPIVPGGFLYASDISNEGRFIVGGGTVNAGGDYSGWIYDEVHGFREIKTLLTSLGLQSQVQGWTLWDVLAISADGLTIGGYGTNPDGFDEAWIAVIPEPGTLVGLTLSTLLLLVRSRRMGLRR